MTNPSYPCEVCGKETNGAVTSLFVDFRHVLHPACHNSVMLRVYNTPSYCTDFMRYSLSESSSGEFSARMPAYMSWLAARDAVRDDLAASLKQIDEAATDALLAKYRAANPDTEAPK